MPQPRTLQKAELEAITWEGDQVIELDKKVTVQFNPESLKVAFANQTSGGDQSGGAATQFVAQGPTKLAFDLRRREERERMRNILMAERKRGGGSSTGRPNKKRRTRSKGQSDRRNDAPDFDPLTADTTIQKTESSET
jgi:hypothetical protein